MQRFQSPRFGIASIVVLTCLIAPDSIQSAAASITSDRLISESNHALYASKIVRLSEGGAIIAASRRPYDGTSSQSGFVMKLDRWGRKVWERSWPVTGDEWSFTKKVIPTVDGGAVVAISVLGSRLANYRTLVTRLDRHGRERWQQVFKATRATDLIVQDGRIKLFIFDVSVPKEPRLLTLTLDGAIQSDVVIKSSFFLFNPNLTPLANGDLLLSTLSPNFQERNALLVVSRISPRGTVFERSVKGGRLDNMMSGFETRAFEMRGGDLVLATTYEQRVDPSAPAWQPWVVRMDRTGHLVKEKVVETGQRYAFVADAIAPRGANLIAVGAVSASTLPPTGIPMLETQADGSIGETPRPWGAPSVTHGLIVDFDLFGERPARHIAVSSGLGSDEFASVISGDLLSGCMTLLGNARNGRADSSLWIRSECRHLSDTDPVVFID